MYHNIEDRPTTKKNSTLVTNWVSSAIGAWSFVASFLYLQDTKWLLKASVAPAYYVKKGALNTYSLNEWTLK